MALYYDLPLYADTYSFVLKIFEITKKFDREYKYSLGQDMKKEAISLVRNIYSYSNKAIPIIYSFSFYL